MILGVIAQVRDEIDILRPWLQHVDALFDKAFLIDHQSIDGTSEMIKQAVAQRPGWNYYFLDVKTQLQAATATLIMHEAFASGVDYLFFLDGDEFIQVESRAELEGLLVNRPNPLIAADMHWKNCIRKNLSSHPFSFNELLWIPEKISNHKKIILPREQYFKYGHDLRISHGNHSAFTYTGVKLNSECVGTLMHLPIRSRNQAIRKIILTVIAERGFGTRDPKRSEHTYEMLRRIAQGELDDDDIRGFTIAYDNITKTGSGISEAELLDQKYTLTSFEELHVAQSPLLQLDSIPVETVFASQLANALNNLEEKVPDFVKLKLNNGVITIDPSSLQPAISSKIRKLAFSIKSKLIKNWLSKKSC